MGSDMGIEGSVFLCPGLYQGLKGSKGVFHAKFQGKTDP